MHRLRAPRLAAVALCVMLTPALGSWGETPAYPAEKSFAVVAVIDTGFGPSDGVYTAPELADHPSTYVTGFPVRTQPLPLDASGAERKKLYYFPGTRVIGAISFGEAREGSLLFNEPCGDRVLLDDCGHGAFVTRRAAAQSPDVLIVAVEVENPLEGIVWAIDQPWIDVISLSWGTLGSLPIGGGNISNLTYRATQQGKVVTVAAGNGLTNYEGVPDRMPTYTDPFSGPSWVVTVGAYSETCGYMWSYSNTPPDVVAASPSGGGTSLAAPVVAGQVGGVLAAGRDAVGDTGEGPRGGLLAIAPGAGTPQGPLQDGKLTRAELEAVVFHTARVETQYGGGVECTSGDGPLEWLRCVTTYHCAVLGPANIPGVDEDLDPQFVLEGYGRVDATSGAKAGAVVRGDAPEPPRLVEDAFMLAGDAGRDAIWLPGASGMLNGIGGVPGPNPGPPN